MFLNKISIIQLDFFVYVLTIKLNNSTVNSRMGVSNNLINIKLLITNTNRKSKGNN